MDLKKSKYQEILNDIQEDLIDSKLPFHFL
jgi:hypothetical protein